MVDQFNVACSIVTALAAPVLVWQEMSVALCAMSHRLLGVVWLTYICVASIAAERVR
jgi:hypothetical protein